MLIDGTCCHLSEVPATHWLTEFVTGNDYSALPWPNPRGLVMRTEWSLIPMYKALYEAIFAYVFVLLVG